MSDQIDDGDILTVNGMYADGTYERDDTPPAAYANKPLKRFRAKVAVDVNGIRAVQMIPLNDDDTIDIAWQMRWRVT